MSHSLNIAPIRQNGAVATITSAPFSLYKLSKWSIQFTTANGAAFDADLDIQVSNDVTSGDQPGLSSPPTNWTSVLAAQIVVDADGNYFVSSTTKAGMVGPLPVARWGRLVMTRVAGSADVTGSVFGIGY